MGWFGEVGPMIITQASTPAFCSDADAFPPMTGDCP
jgi:hypothetical protein